MKRTGAIDIGAQILEHFPATIQRAIKQAYRNYVGLVDFFATLVGLIPSHAFRRAMYRRVLGVHLGEGSIMHWQIRFFKPSGVHIGRFCNIGNGAFLDGREGLFIGDCVATGAEVSIYTLQHDVDSIAFGLKGGSVVIEDYVYVGPRAIILPNVRIGKGAVVAAGAVVTEDVPEFAIVGGVPARFIRERNRDLDYRPSFATPFQ